MEDWREKIIEEAYKRIKQAAEKGIGTRLSSDETQAIALENTVQCVATLQQIMQVLGPKIPDVDYTDRGNLAGLTEDVSEVLRILHDAGFEFRRRKHRVKTE